MNTLGDAMANVTIVPPRDDGAGGRWIGRLLAIAAALYGVTALLLVAGLMNPALGWAALGAVVSLVVLAILAGILGPVSHAPLRSRPLPRDPWVEEWAALMRRPLR